MRALTALSANVEVEVWVTVENDELTMQEAAARLREMGNRVVSIDHTLRRVCVLNTKAK